jgi:hypothetical protein
MRRPERHGANNVALLGTEELGRYLLLRNLCSGKSLFSHHIGSSELSQKEGRRFNINYPFFRYATNDILGLRYYSHRGRGGNK